MLKRIAIIAGEASGDLLAARLIKVLREQRPSLAFEGVAGPEMQVAGCTALFPLERLSVMGLVEVLQHLPSLLKMRRQLVQHWRANPPDLFIGVDAPDFNLPVAARLKALGIPTVHYVSPSVWAWRTGRVKRMRAQVDLMLTLFPFEVEFYQYHQVPALFVGHPLADEISFNASSVPARQVLNLPLDLPILALLPGSRRSEIKQLGVVFLQTAQRLQQQNPALQVVIPVVNTHLAQQLKAQQQQYAPSLRVHYQQGRSRLLMQAADSILLASGTAVLEGMLSGRLMVAAYRVAPLTAWLIKTFKLLKVNYVTLPNQLAQEALVPEVLQDEVSVERLSEAMQMMWAWPPQRRDYVLQRFAELHAQLRCGASQRAAAAILEFSDAKA